MLGKVGLAALVILPVFGATHGSDLRQLYNAMYPINTIKRVALNICHESDPNFVRALNTDRVSCYRQMPNSIKLAIGIIPLPSGLFALGPIPEGPRPGLFASVVLPPIRQPLDRARQVAAFLAIQRATVPACGATAPSHSLSMAAMDLLARHDGAIDDAALAAIVRSDGLMAPPEQAASPAGVAVAEPAALSLTVSAAPPGSACTAPA